MAFGGGGSCFLGFTGEADFDLTSLSCLLGLIYFIGDLVGLLDLSRADVLGLDLLLLSFSHSLTGVSSYCVLDFSSQVLDSLFGVLDESGVEGGDLSLG